MPTALTFNGRRIARSALPVDPYDPSGKPLRPFLRDGKLMGAYSVYADGVDDGGNKGKDRYFPLYGPLEAPVVVAEPTAP